MPQRPRRAGLSWNGTARTGGQRVYSCFCLGKREGRGADFLTGRAVGLVESGGGHGANICFPDGSIRRMDDVVGPGKRFAQFGMRNSEWGMKKVGRDRARPSRAIFAVEGAAPSAPTFPIPKYETVRGIKVFLQKQKPLNGRVAGRLLRLLLFQQS